MKLALLALALLTTPAAAKTWVNDDCSLLVTSGDKGFEYESLDIGDSTLCTVKSWPISSAVATMQCDNGSSPKMEILTDDTISFDGQTFSTKNERCIDE